MKQLYIHGLGQTPAVWHPVLRLLNAPADCAEPDLASLVCNQPATYANLYSAFARLCDESEAKLALCGLSLGGVLALHYAVEHPERVGALVLIAPQYKMPKRLLQIQNALFHLMPASMFGETGFFQSTVYSAVRQHDKFGFYCRPPPHLLPHLSNLRQPRPRQQKGMYPTCTACARGRVCHDNGRRTRAEPRSTPAAGQAAAKLLYQSGNGRFARLS